jgi:hypothetical protein
MDTRIEARERRLLGRERYYRRARRACGACAVVLATASVLVALYAPPAIAAVLPPRTVVVWLLALLGIGYESHLRIMHIETIHHYRSKRDNKSV